MTVSYTSHYVSFTQPGIYLACIRLPFEDEAAIFTGPEIRVTLGKVLLTLLTFYLLLLNSVPLVWLIAHKQGWHTHHSFLSLLFYFRSFCSRY